MGGGVGLWEMVWTLVRVCFVFGVGIGVVVEVVEYVWEYLLG